MTGQEQDAAEGNREYFLKWKKVSAEKPLDEETIENVEETFNGEASQESILFGDMLTKDMSVEGMKNVESESFSTKEEDEISYEKDWLYTMNEVVEEQEQTISSNETFYSEGAKGSLDSEKGKSADIEPGKIAEKARTNFKIQIYGLGIIILLPIIIIMIGVNLKKR